MSGEVHVLRMDGESMLVPVSPKSSVGELKRRLKDMRLAEVDEANLLNCKMSQVELLMGQRKLMPG